MELDSTNGERAREEKLTELAEKLESRGLSSRVETYSDGKPGEELIVELIATNPAARERGEVRIGDDGAVTWEFFGDLGEAGAARILDEATNALRATGVRLQRENRRGAELAGTAEQQLIYLNTHWGRSYSFTVPAGPDDTWKATAQFGAKDELEDPSPVGLLAKMREHYQANRAEEL
ncbi:MAG TPA: hypothetical protein VHY31_24090 [Streptosporangiaceae bacterium]|nr:hypothetical protein [Streptosporangiaceae bacterium]